MWRALAVFLTLLLVAWAEFQFYPGHTYLGSTSQLYVPILEHLATPGYLSRDLIATHPNVTYTVYDEITLFLHEAGRLDFAAALAGQQFVCRLAGVFGMFLLARAARLNDWFSVAVTALFNAGTFLPGLNVALIDPEPVPRAFAFGLSLLAMGFLARNKPLLSGLFGGLAVLYDPITATPFWIFVLAAFAFDRLLRRLLRPVLPILLVFLLLLANLAQLQPGEPDSQPFLSRFSQPIAAIQKFRAPGLWISLWPSKLVYGYLAVFVIGVWALARIWPGLNRQTRWMLALLPCLGVFSMPCSRVLLDASRWSATLRVQPMQTLVYTVSFTFLACATAAVQAFRAKARREMICWSGLCLLFLTLGTSGLPKKKDPYAISAITDWAATNTWGSSMFLFPDAGRELYPGVFRGQSSRALWVDWESGAQISYYAQLAEEWWTRWSGTMQAPLSGDQVQRMLSLPIDYFVFKRSHVLETELEGRHRRVKPVFADREFAVYEASSLRLVPGELRVLDLPSGVRH
ncbi:MAG: hypothetical protein M3Y24_06000 [Acidobacteriota bacterium]|nr:hypothetical protein [Acidobacteriota bacterium]